jgi:hypothetical protein
MATNRRLISKVGKDFYVTPAWGTQALIDYVPFKGTILEPCCGNGAMAEVLKTTGNKVIASDLHDFGYGRVKDFFSIYKNVDNIVTNPPFNKAEAMLKHAQDLAAHKVCFLLRTAFLEGISRWENIYSEWPPARVLVFSKRLSIYPASSKRTGGGTTSYSWFIWDRDDYAHTTISWIKPK